MAMLVARRWKDESAVSALRKEVITLNPQLGDHRTADSLIRNGVGESACRHFSSQMQRRRYCLAKTAWRRELSGDAQWESLLR
jgi:hypothetical protein